MTMSHVPRFRRATNLEGTLYAKRTKVCASGQGPVEGEWYEAWVIHRRFPFSIYSYPLEHAASSWNSFEAVKLSSSCNRGQCRRMSTPRFSAKGPFV